MCRTPSPRATGLSIWEFAATYTTGLPPRAKRNRALGAAYNIKRTNTVLRVSYARTLETPFNENLIIANSGCSVPVIAALVPCVACNLTPGTRNEFHAGLQQAFGKYFVVDGEYIWKYTNNAYDFSVLGNTPITFPIQWDKLENSRSTRRARACVNFHGFTALVVMSSVAARFFPPQVGGLGVTVGQSGHRYSASTTTRRSTKPRTCNTSRGDRVHGSDLTGAMTAAWWRERCLSL